jgi:hypothetical protein
VAGLVVAAGGCALFYPASNRSPALGGILYFGMKFAGLYQKDAAA